MEKLSAKDAECCVQAKENAVDERDSAGMKKKKKMMMIIMVDVD